MNFSNMNQKDSQRAAILGAMMAIEQKVQKLSPHPDRPAQRGLLFVQKDARTGSGSEHDGMLGMVAAQSFLGGVFGPGLSMAWDAAEMASETCKDRADGRYGLGVKGSLNGTFNQTSKTVDARDALETSFRSDLPVRSALEQRYATLSQMLDKLEGQPAATWQMANMRPRMAAGLSL